MTRRGFLNTILASVVNSLIAKNLIFFQNPGGGALEATLTEEGCRAIGRDPAPYREARERTKKPRRRG